MATPLNWRIRHMTRLSSPLMLMLLILSPLCSRSFTVSPLVPARTGLGLGLGANFPEINPPPSVTMISLPASSSSSSLLTELGINLPFSLDRKDVQQQLQEKAQRVKLKSDQLSQDVQDNRALAAQRKADKLREYDRLFEKEEKDQNALYGKMYLENRQSGEGSPEPEPKYTNGKPDVIGNLMAQLQDAKRDVVRFETDIAEAGDTTEVFSLKFALKKAEERRDVLQRRLNLEQNLDDIRSVRENDEDLVRVRAERAKEEQLRTMEKIEVIKERERIEALAVQAKKDAAKEEIQERKEQLKFEMKMDTIDTFVDRKGLVK